MASMELKKLYGNMRDQKGGVSGSNIVFARRRPGSFNLSSYQLATPTRYHHVTESIDIAMEEINEHDK